MPRAHALAHVTSLSAKAAMMMFIHSAWPTIPLLVAHVRCPRDLTPIWAFNANWTFNTPACFIEIGCFSVWEHAYSITMKTGPLFTWASTPGSTAPDLASLLFCAHMVCCQSKTDEHVCNNMTAKWMTRCFMLKLTHVLHCTNVPRHEWTMLNV